MKISGEIFKLFIEGDDLYATMLQAIADAKESIRLESYIFADDAVGNQFCEALVERAKAGVKVRLQIDAAGSLFWFSRKMQNYLRGNAVQLRWFHRWNWRKPWRYNRRNHRKLLVVDDRVAFLGGFNIHKENSRAHVGDMRWRDTHVSFGGELAEVASQLFDAFWRGHLRWVPEQRASGSKLLHNHTLTCHHHLRCIYGEAFENAKKYIYLTTPYFVPDSLTLRHLRQAAVRGVDVRLLVPRINDVRATSWAAHYVYASLFAVGVKIYEYLPRMLHTKAVVIDGNWSIVGTANLDYRSFFTNYELNLATADSRLAAELKEQFMRDLSLSELIQPQDWERRDWLSRRLEWIAMIVRRWL